MLIFLFVLNAYASPYTECFETKAKAGLTCELMGHDLQSLFNDSKRACAQMALAEIMREGGDFAAGAEKMTVELPPLFERMVNEKIASCGRQGEFKFHGTGGSLILR